MARMLKLRRQRGGQGQSQGPPEGAPTGYGPPGNAQDGEPSGRSDRGPPADTTGQGQGSADAQNQGPPDGFGPPDSADASQETGSRRPPTSNSDDVDTSGRGGRGPPSTTEEDPEQESTSGDDNASGPRGARGSSAESTGRGRPNGEQIGDEEADSSGVAQGNGKTNPADSNAAGDDDSSSSRDEDEAPDDDEVGKPDQESETALADTLATSTSKPSKPTPSLTASLDPAQQSLAASSQITTTSNKLPLAVIIGAVSGGAVLLLLLLWCLYRRRQKKDAEKYGPLPEETKQRSPMIQPGSPFGIPNTPLRTAAPVRNQPGNYAGQARWSGH